MNKNYISPLKENTLVIHLKYGLGKYKGLIIIKNNGLKAEYLIILYANDVKLYVPIFHLYLIKPYVSEKLNHEIKLHKLGSKIWQIQRKKIFKNIEDIAIKLLHTHANRISKKGFSFHINTEKYQLFCTNFPFTITQDQKLVIKEVISDMNKPIPMDRLVCGDVGFGKTEIALRAAFIAVDNKKQVIILVPTTLLTQQHYQVFTSRFSNFSVKITLLSRFSSKKEEKKCFEEIKQGKINILIGTHKILLNPIKWFDLGLLIIDEEHRFGVRQKESIKKMFCHIDILTLTATPIPRTLHMGFYGMRDLSMISTPPKNRQAVKTFVKQYDDTLVKKIIQKEISRNGQVYYVYNKVKQLEEKLIQLQQLIPEATFKIGHGKMNGNYLKKLMHDFYKKKFNVLICTTIIETGIDIPNVNSIIIEHAHSFGLAQLHQMRGRVGRSKKQAYAWLLIQNFKNLPSNAKKRLKAIESVQYLGSGFTLSIHDLKIRGIGEILGYHQSGHMKNIELSLYIELLKTSIICTQNNTHLSFKALQHLQPEIELSVSMFFPKYYMKNTDQKLYFYKKIFSSETKSDLLNIHSNLIHKFGILPIEVKNLFFFARIKILSKNIGILKIYSDQFNTIITFSEYHNENNMNILIKLCKLESKIWKMQNIYSVKFIHDVSEYNVRISWILNFLKKIQKIISYKNILNSNVVKIHESC